MINFILYGIVGFFVLWFFFINVMTWRKYEAKIPKIIKPLLYVLAAVGYVIDVIFNIVYGSVMFLELPKQLTLSERLSEILRRKSRGYKYKLAYFLCSKMIEPWDYNHCGLKGK